MATLGLRSCFEFVTRETFEADGEAGLSDSEVLKNWLERPPPEVPSTTTGDAGDVNGKRATGLDAEREDSAFFKSYISRTLNEVYNPERDLEAVNKGGKTIYSDTVGIINPKSEATTPHTKEDKEPIEREVDPKVRFQTRVELEDETHGVDVSDEGDDEDGDSRDDEGEEESEPREKKTRGHRREAKEAKKVSDDWTDSLPCG